MTITQRWSRQNDFDATITAASRQWNVPVALIKAVIGVESGFNPQAVNKNDPGWAWGLMQMIPTTARGLGYTGPMDVLLTDTTKAINLGAELLKQNMVRTRGVVADSVSAYNGGFRPALGFGSKRADGTYGNQQYVVTVLAAYDYFLAYDASRGGVSGGSPASFLGGSGVDDRRVVDPPPVPPPSPVSWWQRFLTRLVRAFLR